MIAALIYNVVADNGIYEKESLSTECFVLSRRDYHTRHRLDPDKMIMHFSDASHILSAYPLASRTMKHSSRKSSIDQGGGKRRGDIERASRSHFQTAPAKLIYRLRARLGFILGV
jgi:hypothetical protein